MFVGLPTNTDFIGLLRAEACSDLKQIALFYSLHGTSQCKQREVLFGET